MPIQDRNIQPLVSVFPIEHTNREGKVYLKDGSITVVKGNSFNSTLWIESTTGTPSSISAVLGTVDYDHGDAPILDLSQANDVYILLRHGRINIVRNKDINSIHLPPNHCRSTVQTLRTKVHHEGMALTLSSILFLRRLEIETTEHDNNDTSSQNWRHEFLYHDLRGST